MSFLDYLVQNTIIDQSDISRIEEEITRGEHLDKAAIDSGADPVRLFQVKQEYFSHLPVSIQESEKALSPETLQYIPENTATVYGIAPLSVAMDGTVTIGILDPDNLAAKSALEFISAGNGMTYNLSLISYEYYAFIVENYSGLKGEVKKALGELAIDESLLNAEVGAIDPESDVTNKITEDAPITKIVSNILKHAAETGTSDIHIEPFAYGTDVRYRMDGVLQKDLTLPRNIHGSVIARVKILSKIKLDEKRVPQDGRFSASLLGRKIDFRVSTFPTYYGEKCVMRLLESERGAMSVTDLGFTEENLQKIRRAIGRPYGIILVCGPTGSGKTNTLYSLLNEVDKEGENVLSLENPIELNIPGVSQSQMRPDIGYTFAKGLRSVLRQDPDIIMVGEIRDTETAKLAIQAALTGHLVLSTIHTNTAPDVVQRLVDMGVEPYLIGPTLISVVGQRLARTLSPDGGKKVDMPASVRSFIDKQISDLPENLHTQFTEPKYTYEAVPSDEFPTGTKGRVGVFEVMEMDEELEQIILTDPSSLAIYRQARKNGMITFKEDAILKAVNGRITFEEVLKL